ncbi:uncharacterized protein LOC115626524 [Scaptodrosophila lebanonensis]|uniref:Uncharacterized protein LOC115626524 n=1 Tax=Drosophila lebanonensis TaxID=7225 RepID=A0A6J2TRM9_DROLE|nr:uncharacterized protein LOC115626524 [Scaptodrosophila lebanonensis]
MLRKKEKDLADALTVYDVAPWYRQLSVEQLRAIEILPDALRDDDEQGTTFRVRKCLTDLGIVPLIDRRPLKKLIIHSRGDDIAFLYFLLEGFYRTGTEAEMETKTKYTTYEQILMSSIQHLDLELTLRELDRILPPGHLNKRQMRQLRQRRVEKAKEARGRGTVKFHVPGRMENLPSVMPYFLRHPRPQKPKKNKFICKYPDVIAHFPFWPAHKQQQFNIKREKRWYADYKLQPVLRLIKEVVNGVIDDYWHQMNCGTKVVNHDQLCAYHTFMQEQEQLIKDEMTLKARDRCIEMVDVTGRQSKQRHSRIIDLLDREIEEYTQRCQKLKQMDFTNTTVMKNCELCASRVPTTMQEDEVKFMIEDTDIGRTKSATSGQVVRLSEQRTLRSVGGVDVLGKDPAEVLKQKKLNAACPSHLKHRPKPTKPKKRRVSILPGDHVHVNNSNCSCKRRVSNTHKAGKQCFIAAQLHKPYRFQYQHTFHDEYRPPTVDCVIRRQAVRSLRSSNSNCCSCTSASFIERCPRAKVVDAIATCAKNMWSKSLQAYQLLTKDEKVTKGGKACKNDNVTEEGLLQYDQTYFDANDIELMDRMLQDGLRLLRRDKRFVLASFPNAHKLQVMREWIKRRYGQRYTQKNIAQFIKRAQAMVSAIVAMQSTPPNLQAHDVPLEPTTYGRHQELMVKAETVKNNYKRLLNNELMQHISHLWNAMNCISCNNAAIRDGFYAYLPARNVDVLRVCPWNGDFRNIKTYREDRIATELAKQSGKPI